MPVLLDSVTKMGDNFSIASTPWNTLNRYSQCFCSITPSELGIYGAIEKILKLLLKCTQIRSRIQEPSFIIFSHSFVCGECDRFIKWIGKSELAKLNQGGPV